MPPLRVRFDHSTRKKYRNTITFKGTKKCTNVRKEHIKKYTQKCTNKKKIGVQANIKTYIQMENKQTCKRKNKQRNVQIQKHSKCKQNNYTDMPTKDIQTTGKKKG